MAEAGGVPKQKVDEEEDGDDALQKKSRISGSKKEEDQAKNQVQHDRLHSKLEDFMKRNEWLLFQWEREEATGLIDQARRDAELLGLIRSLQLQHQRLLSKLKDITKRNKWLLRQWEQEEATGAGRNDQPDI
ncbi:hypothetical protein AMTR_s00005p00245750 [Amborella trichopoda]|uniref:Uncharacterized protein n=1 Tax=Amborella trichopoda TaxID=13333 RepID=W1PFZ0_AMBTC|nr:hypothetical protein AMTR_s00005p00245750 [Amborella trichopoda]